jgi:hypothetical protein
VSFASSCSNAGDMANLPKAAAVLCLRAALCSSSALHRGLPSARVGGAGELSLVITKLYVGCCQATTHFIINIIGLPVCRDLMKRKVYNV